MSGWSSRPVLTEFQPRKSRVAHVVLANRYLIGVSDGIANKEHHPEAGAVIERERQ